MPTPSVVFRIEVDEFGQVTVKDSSGGLVEPCVTHVSREPGEAYEFGEFKQLVGAEMVTVLLLRNPATQALIRCIKLKDCRIYCG